MNPRITFLDPAQYRRTPWKNGGGVTVDIAFSYRDGATPGDWSGMLWRFGRTRIERPGPFSDLSGYDRLLAVIEGDGLMLHVRGGATLDVQRPLETVRFDGAWPIDSAPINGPVGVLNLMADQSRFSIALCFPAPGERMLLPAGHAIILALGDAALRVDGAEISLRPDWSCAFDPVVPTALETGRGRIAVATIALQDRAARRTT